MKISKSITEHWKKRRIAVGKSGISDESRRKMSISRVGNKNALGMKHTEETKRKMREWTIKHNKTMNLHSPSKPERKMKEILEKIETKYIHQKIIEVFTVDFFIPEKMLIIEVDGKYWHNYPNGTEKDKIRDKKLQELGYKIVRFWEGEFDENIVRQKLEQF